MLLSSDGHQAAAVLADPAPPEVGYLGATAVLSVGATVLLNPR